MCASCCAVRACSRPACAPGPTPDEWLKICSTHGLLIWQKFKLHAQGSPALMNAHAYTVDEDLGLMVNCTEVDYDPHAISCPRSWQREAPAVVEAHVLGIMHPDLERHACTEQPCSEAEKIFSQSAWLLTPLAHSATCIFIMFTIGYCGKLPSLWAM